MDIGDDTGDGVVNAYMLVVSGNAVVKLRQLKKFERLKGLSPGEEGADLSKTGTSIGITESHA